MVSQGGSGAECLPPAAPDGPDQQEGRHSDTDCDTDLCIYNIIYMFIYICNIYVCEYMYVTSGGSALAPHRERVTWHDGL